ncbi:hypothetical protein ANN_18037 [Periplaneta americana]|uniref:Matrin-type domain-containing protein n=1 Tax=Periplaneta americana TaxID=6978 RepID=A0ABQ8SP01_PERAM|nr:hypothetical protein ANN_18037 [Periplaneta americana]
MQTAVKCSALRSMAQKERNTSWKLEYLVSLYGADVFYILNNNLYCKLCYVRMTSAKNKEYNAQRHVSTMTHKRLEQGNVQKGPINTLQEKFHIRLRYGSSYYVENIYNTCITEVRGKLTNQQIWVSIDERTDAVGRHVVNVIVGALDPEGPAGSSLLSYDVINAVNNSTICGGF